MAIISALYIYPVKSLAGISLASATLGEHGLRWRDLVTDRQWMLVLANGRFVTQRQWPQLAQIKTELSDEALILHHHSADSIRIPYQYDASRTCQVTVWRDEVTAFDEGDAVADWLAQVTGTESGVRMVRFGAESNRAVSSAYLWQGEQSQVGFSDGYPILVTNTASLEQFNHHLRQQDLSPMAMTRFRPNVVLTHLEPWKENQLTGISHQKNNYQLGFRKPCERCPVITIDQQTGDKPEQAHPLKALLDYDALGHGQGAYFGQNAIICKGVGQFIEVGDDVRLDD